MMSSKTAKELIEAQLTETEESLLVAIAVAKGELKKNSVLDEERYKFALAGLVGNKFIDMLYEKGNFSLIRALSQSKSPQAITLREFYTSKWDGGFSSTFDVALPIIAAAKIKKTVEAARALSGFKRGQ